MVDDDSNMGRFFGALDTRLSRIEYAIDRAITSHDIFEEKTNARLAVLELERARQEGGKKALAGLLAAAATAGGLVATIVQNFWPR